YGLSFGRVPSAAQGKRAENGQCQLADHNFPRFGGMDCQEWNFCVRLPVAGRADVDDLGGLCGRPQFSSGVYKKLSATLRPAMQEFPVRPSETGQSGEWFSVKL